MSRKNAALGRLPCLALGPDHHVWSQGAAPRGELLFVRQGILRLERVTAAGERRIVGLAGRGMLLGLEAWLGQTHADDLVSCTEVRLLRLRCGDADRAMRRQPQRYTRLLRHWQQGLSEAQAWSAELLRGCARQRTLQLIQRLLLLSAARGSHPTVWLPRRHDMGAMLGLTEETVSRQISGLRRDGIVKALDPRNAQVDIAALARALAAT
ncbi:Crp/Fnr family transcriptional regulator [Paucibacter sediminis]|uniref:Crp/Fnr family transcriptional regulator n=1 Tax=Paucibacter sediminis TaxID=3019553 RepID=A0AA95NFL8_9BURK|nr:Crp/Fnr family transcriptional regulator [Paucibacter sp. S2-9]WIT14142.1 Crp/Fnr family transcriptional regulator [Paucibacter sp. S2-9]